jgi:hypothetical protein
MAPRRWIVRALAVAAGAASVVSSGAVAADATPAPCTRASAERSIRTFLTAFDRGDQAALRRAIAPASQFKWYSVGGPGGRYSMQSAARYSTLFRYFEARHRRHEQMQETRFQWYGVEPGSQAEGVRLGGLAFTVTRQAADLPATLVSGKGAVTCSAPNRLAVWSLATTTLPGMGPLDPVPITP